MSQTIPIIDFVGCGLLVANEADVGAEVLRETGKRLYEALAKSGFACLKNVGIPRRVIDETNDVTEEFFKLPEEEKMKYNLNSFVYGYDPNTGNSKNPKRPNDNHEGFRASSDALADENTEWPDVPGFHKAFSDTSDLCTALTRRIFRALGVAMDLEDTDYFLKTHSSIGKKGGMTQLKALYYPPIDEESGTDLENRLRLCEHTDFTSITLLFQDNIGGLQVKNPDGEFEDAPPVTDTMLLNVGDMLQFWSGNRLKSAVHRVRIPEDPKKRQKKRRSLVYFVEANDEILLEELQFKDSVVKAPTEPVMTAREFMDDHFAKYFTSDR